MKKIKFYQLSGYFMILPLAGTFLSSNQLALLYKQPSTAGNKIALTDHVKKFLINKETDTTKGDWAATIKDKYLVLEFKSEKMTEHWNSSSSIPLNEFQKLPGLKKEQFYLIRDAGKIFFYGSFDGNHGSGTYQFLPNPAYCQQLQQNGITGINDHDLFTYLLINIKKDYVRDLIKQGYHFTSKRDLIPMATSKIDADYIRSFNKLGYDHLTTQQLVSAKALKIDSTYINKVRRTGNENLSINEVIRMKANHME